MSENVLDPAPILVALDCPEVLSVQRLQGNSGTAIWRVDTAKATYTLRVFAPGYATICEREAAAMSQAATYGIPTAQVHAVTIWQEHPAMLLTWMPGETLAAALQRQPWQAWHLGIQFGRTQAAIHAVAAPTLLCASLDSWMQWGSQRHPSLQGRLWQAPHQQDKLLHLDYHPLNVLTDGAHITGVIDWTNARAGDPRADMARTETILRLDSMGANDKGWVALAKHGIVWIFLQGWRHGYRAINPDLSEMALFYAWAGAMMEADLADKRTSAGLARVRHWTDYWMRMLE